MVSICGLIDSVANVVAVNMPNIKNLSLKTTYLSSTLFSLNFKLNFKIVFAIHLLYVTILSIKVTLTVKEDLRVKVILVPLVLHGVQ